MAKTVVAEADRRRRRPTKQGVLLSEELIVETALRMVREHGAAGLSARRLGLALGADASAVYRYFRGMDDLTLALGNELIRQALAGWSARGDWFEDLYRLGLRIHAAYLAHPQAAVLTASRVSGGASELAVDEAILGSLREAGFPDPEAVRVYHVFIDQCLAFAALDAASLVLPEPALASDRGIWRSTYAQLPSSTHPHLAATAPLLAERMNDSAYPAALRMVLESAAARLAAG
ncbi:TetR/AcrR family transcriptional regulator C-terminal domain-containing protein [Actinospica durhamensis]|uniref:TetR/AcrR family transcriptional regulator C-terminal domain-containing protein n=1 Tax=Actinospica durhamensis TaxID=1508375 RepID=A0A941ES09_9ACTN|nr:TetR/AcrR family transcriptional regulator [Actinospica durhamensis]MBR7835417.1 TetR/AcrR family transcriptional regulator C-terminal domain-containing protein [Actinospica durhamensis]